MWGIVVILALMIPLIAVILDSQLGRALAARLERDAGGRNTSLSERVSALEGEVDRLTGEVERLRDEAEFLHRLLEHRTPEGEALPPGDVID